MREVVAVAVLTMLSASAAPAEDRILALNVAAVRSEGGVVGEALYYVGLRCSDAAWTRAANEPKRLWCHLEVVSVNNCYFSGGDKLGETNRKVQWPKVEQADTDDRSLVIVTDRPRLLVVRWIDPTPFGPAETQYRFDYSEHGSVTAFSGTTTKNSDVLEKMISMDWRPVSSDGDTAIPAKCEFYAPPIIPRPAKP